MGFGYRTYFLEGLPGPPLLALKQNSGLRSSFREEGTCPHLATPLLGGFGQATASLWALLFSM